MPSRIQAVLRGVEHDQQLIRLIEKRLAHLERLLSNITHCEVLVTKLHEQHRHRTKYRVRIELAVPGMQILGRSRDTQSESNDVC